MDSDQLQTQGESRSFLTPQGLDPCFPLLWLRMPITVVMSSGAVVMPAFVEPPGWGRQGKARKTMEMTFWALQMGRELVGVGGSSHPIQPSASSWQVNQGHTSLSLKLKNEKVGCWCSLSIYSVLGVC